MTRIERIWNERFPAPPCGYLLRAGGAPNWLRTHSLPKSKSYPESPDEWRIWFERNNSIATEVLGQNSDCLLFLSAYENAPFTEFSWWSRFNFDYLTGLEISAKLAEEQGDPNFFACETMWQTGDFDDVLGDVAEDLTGCVTFYSLATGQVYAPYDGGVDLFLATPEVRRELKDRWSDWLSDRPDGL